jgi:hypothetical protein
MVAFGMRLKTSLKKSAFEFGQVDNNVFVLLEP